MQNSGIKLSEVLKKNSLALTYDGKIAVLQQQKFYTFGVGGLLNEAGSGTF